MNHYKFVEKEKIRLGKEKIYEIDRPKTREHAMRIFEMIDDSLWEGILRIHYDHGSYLYYRLIFDLNTWVKIFHALRNNIFFIVEKIPPEENYRKFIENYPAEFDWENELDYNDALVIRRANHLFHCTQLDFQENQCLNIVNILLISSFLPKDICNIVASYYVINILPHVCTKFCS